MLFLRGGEIVWQKYKNDIFQTKIINPIVDNIKYSEEFMKNIEKLNPYEKYQLNKSIEKLENYVIKKENLKSLFHTGNRGRTR
jgi:hypothetical protein